MFYNKQITNSTICYSSGIKTTIKVRRWTRTVACMIEIRNTLPLEKLGVYEKYSFYRNGTGDC